MPEADFSILPSAYGPSLYVRAPWRAEMLDEMIRREIVSIELLEGSLGTPPDASFLADLPSNVVSVYVRSRTLKDLSAIHSLHSLKNIALSCDALEKPVKFDCFPHLESLSFDWRAGICDNVSSLPAIKFLSIGNYPNRDLTELGDCLCEKLYIPSARIEVLKGLGALPRLAKLLLVNCRKLVSIDEVPPSLVTLEVRDCWSLRNIDGLANSPSLKLLTLIMCGQRLATLEPLRRHPTLEQVGISTRVVDGDMSVLFDMPQLRRAGFVDRRGYSNTSQELEDMLYDRWGDSGHDSRYEFVL